MLQSICVELTISLDPAACPEVKGSAAYIRPTCVEWKASRYIRADGKEYVHEFAYVRGFGRRENRMAPGGAVFSDEPGDFRVPEWLPRPPAGWMSSLDCA